VYRSAYVEDAEGENLTKRCRNLGIIRKDAVAATGVVEFSRDSAASTDYTIPSGTLVETLGDEVVTFETVGQVTLSSGTSSVKATVRGVEPGADTNVGPNAIQVMPSPPTGVDSVTNPSATGDPSLTDTNGDPLVQGRDREDDDELRKRTLEIDATGEGPSGDGIEIAVENTEGVVGSTLKTNQTPNTVNGLGPYETELVVYGGDAFDIATTLYETMSITGLLRLVGGVNGTSDQETVYSELLDEDVTIPFSRATETNLTLEIDVVHTSTYDGDTVVKDTVVNYIGGTYADDTETTGLTIGVNVLVNEIENRIEDVQGVDFADVTLLDADSDGNDDTTTDADGVPVYSVADSEVAQVDADDITLTTTAR
jgi:hypothetical protein